MKKMRMIAAAGGLFLGSMLLSGCEAKVTAQVPEVIQIQNVDKSQDGKITLSSSEMVEIVPDMAEIVFCVTTQHEQAGECQQENTRKLNELLEFLKGQGFDEKKIKTSGFSLDTRYDWSGDKQQIIGYEMRTQVAVTDIPADSVGMVLSKGVESGANEIYSVSWFSSEYDKAYSEALAKAVDLAKMKGEALAAASGKKLGEVLSIQEYGDNQYGRYIRDTAMMKNAAATGAMEAGAADMDVMPGEMQVTANISIEFELTEE